ncbi:sensor histidine kinase [Tenacibaculum amylolyticum]|uniref:sensor histidine kinase n=1 Tax=Tenacibaculum amylolyticum TaxID=104269 RepID=UPI003894F825
MLLDLNSPFYSWIRGGVVMLFIYHLIIYLRSREEVHKFYTLYLFCITVYIVRDAFPSKTVQNVYEYISFSIQYVGYYFFIGFTRSLVNSKKNFPKLDKCVTYISKVLLLLALSLVVVQYFYGYELQKKVVAYSAFFTSLMAFLVFYLISKQKTIDVWALLTGSILFLVFANISSIKMIRGDDYLIDFNVNRLFYYFVGATIQSIIFAVLTGNYIRVIAENKRAMEISLLRKENQISNLRLGVLKSQINPHFLFNSLNSINSFVIQNEKELASDYITKFSLLTRKVLQVTDENTITLQEELDILSIYLKLEQARIKNKFAFEIDIDKKIDPNLLRVVPLFLQPFVENSIWHGLTLKEGEKKLKISIVKNKKTVEVRILDNGIGIEKSQQIQKSGLSHRKSYGINIVKERLKITYYPFNVEVTITDNKKLGTEVLIVFPFLEKLNI